MSSTTFTDNVTPIVSSWLNDVNISVYTTFPSYITTETAARIAADATKALLAGDAAQVFSVAPATAAAHAAPKSMFDAASGHIGESVTSTVGSVNAPATNTWGDLTSISVLPGVWDFNVIANLLSSGATIVGGSMGISATAGNSTAGLVIGDTRSEMPPPSSTYSSNGVIPGKRIVVASTTTYYLKMQASYSAGTPVFYGRISATRVAL